ncbi:MAG: hypothetical protein HYV41_03490 [Candidatus Magasanikbacteria bacterium]|nr:hypothetical protein [Candidatus Magasanikbacteria bacterium]
MLAEIFCDQLTKILMIERERQPEQFYEQQEFNFEAGISEAVRRIQKIYETQKYIAIAVIGSGADVGKTTLATQLQRKLMELGMKTAWESNIGNMFYPPYFDKFTEAGQEGGILVLHDEYAPLENTSVQDEQLAMKSKAFELPFSKIDLRIYVYRPDRPFRPEDLKFADIIIKNDHAIDGSWKIRSQNTSANNE